VHGSVSGGVVFCRVVGDISNRENGWCYRASRNRTLQCISVVDAIDQKPDFYGLAELQK
jgi:hypothetical protein